MKLDVFTLSLVLSIASFAQVIALLIQWRLDSSHHGPGWWTLGSAASALGFAMAYLRVIPALVTFANSAYTLLYVGSAVLLYTGVLHFFDRQIQRSAIFAFAGVYTVLIGYFTFIQNDGMVRGAIVYLAYALLTFFIARAFYVYKTRAVSASANFLAAVFLAHGIILIVSVCLSWLAPSDQSALGAPTGMVVSILETLIANTLWTFGFILLFNQQLTVDIREVKDNLELVFDTSPDAILLTSLVDGTIARINDGFTRMTGFTRQDVVGKTVFQIKLWKNPGERHKLFNLLQETGACENFEAIFQRKDGSQLTGIVSASLIKLQDIPYIISVTRDITGRKQAEELLRESQERFRGLLDSQESNIMMFDYDGVHHYANQIGVASISAAGSADDILGKRLHDIYPSQTADWQLKQIRQVFTSGQGLSGDFRNGWEDQSTWWHLNLQPIRNASGQVVQVMVNSMDITDRKRAETVLKDSENFINGVLNSLTAQIAVLDERGVILSVNEAWKKFASANGCQDPACYVGVNYLAVCEAALRSGEQGAAAMLAGMRAVLAGTQAQFVDEYPCDAPGVPRWFTVTVLPQSQPRRGLIVVHQDISERKIIEQALRKSESSLQAVLHSTADGILAVDADDRVLFVNERFVEMWRIPPMVISRRDDAVLIGQVIEQLVNPQEFLDKIEEVYQSERESFDSLNFKDGRVFERLSHPLIREQKAGGRVWSFRDVTERRRMEEQLRETRDALQTIINSSPLAILTLDVDDRITMWNPAAEAMFGWADKHVLGQANPTVPENKLKEYEALRQATLNGITFSNLDTLRMKKDGSPLPVSLSVAPLRGQQGQVIGHMHIMEDITERKKFQEELRQQATTDELTRVSNRRHFLELANSEIKRALRLKRPPAIALIDIDHFKLINDTHGHAAGDQALVGFTKICQSFIREIDVFARFGGDEFVVLLPETSQAQAYEVLERIRLGLRTNLVDLGGRQVALTLSCGITGLSGGADTIDTLLSQADQALYRAKESGRNRVIRYDILNDTPAPGVSEITGA